MKVNVQDAKTNLSRYLELVEKGEVVVVCRYNKPIAEIRPFETPLEKRIPKFGLWDGYGLSKSFFDPLPDDILRHLQLLKLPRLETV
ncbi:MAG: type II toxin-antitoxin system Phd/YefM family antitoxin [Candidatus Solibacter usitatus]|nr:type II toxin-antitoxin system Phd/YefM family antitoxin [Candidatus Solibacter usitatus]